MTTQTQLPFFSAGNDLPLFSEAPALCESCLERPATGELCGSPLCDSCAKEELATVKKLGLPIF